MIPLQPRLDEPPPGCLRTADLLGALSLAADLATGLPAGHAVRSCYIGMHLADQLHLAAGQRAALYYAELLMDVGCTAWTSHLAAAILGDEIEARRDLYFFTDRSSPLEVMTWLREYMAVGAPAHVRLQRSLAFALHGEDALREAFRNTCEVATRFAARLGMPEEVQTALQTPDHPALKPEEALARIGEEAGNGLCADCCETLVQHVRGDGAAVLARKRVPPRVWPAGLTDREVEILRLLTKGLNRRAMAEQLFLSEHTVRHHLEHIYTKLGVSTRVAATLFAVEHDLLN